MNIPTSIKTYYTIYLVLVLLTLLTCGLSLLPQMVGHSTIGLAIAAVKAFLIALFFMHLLSGNGLPWLTLLAGLFWVSILLGLTLTDYSFRAVLSY